MKPKINQLNEDDRAGIGKYAFSVANQNHILRYTEKDYHDFLIENPAALVKMLIFLFVAENWGYDSPRFASYDEEWLAMQVDADFKSELEFELPEFAYENLLPYQKATVDFTQTLLDRAENFSVMLKKSTSMEIVYAVFANNLDLDPVSGMIKNKDHAIQRGLEMYLLFEQGIEPAIRFEQWEVVLF